MITSSFHLYLTVWKPNEQAKRAMKKAACTDEPRVVVQELGKMYEVYQLEIWNPSLGTLFPYEQCMWLEKYIYIIINPQWLFSVSFLHPGFEETPVKLKKKVQSFVVFIKSCRSVLKMQIAPIYLSELKRLETCRSLTRGFTSGIDENETGKMRTFLRNHAHFLKNTDGTPKQKTICPIEGKQQLTICARGTYWLKGEEMRFLNDYLLWHGQLIIVQYLYLLSSFSLSRSCSSESPSSGWPDGRCTNSEPWDATVAASTW